MSKAAASSKAASKLEVLTDAPRCGVRLEVHAWLHHLNPNQSLSLSLSLSLVACGKDSVGGGALEQTGMLGSIKLFVAEV